MKNERRVTRRFVDQVDNGGELRADDRQFMYDLVWAATYALASQGSPEVVVREFERLVEQRGHLVGNNGSFRQLVAVDIVDQDGMRG